MGGGFPLPTVWQFAVVAAAVMAPLAAIAYAAKAGRRARLVVAAAFLLAVAYPFACGGAKYAAGHGWLSSAAGEAPGRPILYALGRGPFPARLQFLYGDFESWCFWKGRHHAEP